MPVEGDGVTSIKGRPLPVNSHRQLETRGREEIEVLEALLREMRAVRLILAAALGVSVEPEEMS